jgi:SAM-dependent methyltransferase
MKSEQSMFDAAIESSRIFSHAVREVADSSGLLAYLGEFRAVDDIVDEMGVIPEKRVQLDCLLRLLASQQIIDEEKRGEEWFYRARTDLGTTLRDGRYVPRTQYITDWFGDGYVESIRTSNIEFLGHDLGFLRKPQEFARFDKTLEEEWRITMTGPLYEYGRMLCVEELVVRGNRFLDLACGPGYGSQRLAQASDGPCTIVALDKSADFVDMTRNLDFPPDTTLKADVYDLNNPLPDLGAQAFDGVMFNGSFHFISAKRERLVELWDMLRPGGLLCLGHTFARSGFADEGMREFYFSMLEDEVYALSWDELVALTEDVGYRQVRSFHQGSYSYLLVERPDEAGARSAE